MPVTVGNNITSIQKISKYFAVGIAEKNPITAKGSCNQGEKVLKFYCGVVTRRHSFGYLVTWLFGYSAKQGYT